MRASIVVAHIATFITMLAMSNATLFHTTDVFDSVTELVSFLHIPINEAVNLRHFGFSASLALYTIGALRGCLA